ncbi:MAG TPA: 4-(cytidine 5'-diphospho)-2-C-methyl-D-erythritol kinase [Ktedonobacterales bacterium]|nr:4-(cytidine 5'-diphospho)-2-C-methyl-D-erythritol kinase [Ktedonobacterales bacterium]
MPWTRRVMLPAFAKVNLTLEVLGRRADGYHELASVMQTVALCDTLALAPAPDAARTLTCDVPELAGAANLALRAAEALAEASGTREGVALELSKAIPTQAGLGGGSSDGATALLALARLWEARRPAGALLEMAARLGSDVPFFLTAGTARVGGRGEVVEPLPDIAPCWLVLLKPPVSVPTAAAFGALAPGDFSAGAATGRVARDLLVGRPVAFDALVNSFEASVARDFPTVAAARAALVAAGAEIVRLSGSGPTLYAPFAGLAAASRAWRALRAGGHDTWLTRTVSRAEALGHIERLTAEAN